MFPRKLFFFEFGNCSKFKQWPQYFNIFKFEFLGEKNKSALPSKIFPTLQSLITWYYVLFISCISLAYCIKGKAELETRNVKSWLKFLRLPKSEWVYTESPQRTLWFIIACNCKGNNFYLPPFLALASSKLMKIIAKLHVSIYFIWCVPLERFRHFRQTSNSATGLCLLLYIFLFVQLIGSIGTLSQKDKRLLMFIFYRKKKKLYNWTFFLVY